MKSKVIISLILGGAAVVVASIIKGRKQYAEVKSSEEADKENTENNEIKEKIAKAAEKVVAWILSHKNEIEAATLALGLMSAVCNFRNKVNEGRKAVDKTPNKKGTLDIVIEDMLKKNYNAASIDWNGIATVDVNLREVAA